MKIQIFKQKKNFRKGGFHVNPDTCWEVIIFVALFLVLAFFVFGLYNFFQINKEFSSSITENTESNNNIVTRERVEKALEYFKEREKKSVEILNSPLPIIDPSI